MSKGLGPFIATNRYAVVFGSAGSELEDAPHTILSTLKTAPRVRRAESSRHISLRYGIYIMHKARNATARREGRRRKLEGEITSDQRIESWSLSDDY